LEAEVCLSEERLDEGRVEARVEARVLAINPGTTSTKFGLFTRTGEVFAQTLRHGDEEVQRFKGRPMLERLEYRAGLMEAALGEAGFASAGGMAGLAGVAGRGGFLGPMACGTYRVNEAMIEVLREARGGEHASNLGAPLALRFAAAAGVQAYVVDPVTVDEWQPCARLTGSPLVERRSIGHWLNTKAVAKRYARERGCRYAELGLIVAHMGSGVTVSAHCGGRAIDSNSIEEGPFGPDRTGGLPVRALARLCSSGTMTAAELDRHLFGDGGLFAYMGTRDLMEVERRAEAGDALAAAVMEAMVYQIAKEMGAMAAVLRGQVEALILTGGMAHSERVLKLLRPQVEWIAPVTVYPGEDELRALADGVFRVLDGEEGAREFVAG
jgi:butyrate kinase